MCIRDRFTTMLIESPVYLEALLDDVRLAASLDGLMEEALPLRRVPLPRFRSRRRPELQRRHIAGEYARQERRLRRRSGLHAAHHVETRTAVLLRTEDGRGPY